MCVDCCLQTFNDVPPASAKAAANFNGRFIQSRLKKLSILLPVLSMPQRDNFLLFYFVFTSSRSPGTFVEYLEVVAVYATSATVPPVVEDCHQDHLYH